MSSQTISIIGCGWLGLPLAERLAGEGKTLKGSTTSAEKLAVLSQSGIEGHLLKLSPEPVGDLQDLLAADVLIVNIPPKAGKMGDDFHPKQIKHLIEPIRGSAIQHVIYVSSTSVYPELNRIVVEKDVVAPDQAAASALVQAEQEIQALAADRSVTILRCGGLMGYDRIPGKYVAGKQVNSGDVPVNYLHRDDAINILQTIIERKVSGVYNAVSPKHPTREAIYRKSCADFGYALPTFITPAQPVAYKVISPGKLLKATDYTFQYPDPLAFYYELGT
ncbi:Rossmann-fold NAD(P)-binding domain-containing protein [Spirosoma fluminis]